MAEEAGRSIPPLPSMLVLFWNCRGLGQASTISYLRAMLRQSNSDCLCIVETKIFKATSV